MTPKRLLVVACCIFATINFSSAQSWTQTSAPNDFWVTIACSADATRLMAATETGFIYGSTNLGLTWTQSINAPSLEWRCIASSSDGTKWVAAGGGIYTSTNFGATWT